MTKSEFISALADELTISTKEATRFLDGFNTVLTRDIFAKEDKIALPWGTLSGAAVTKAARTAKNPRTGESIAVAAKVYHGLPKLKVAKKYKEEVCEERA